MRRIAIAAIAIIVLAAASITLLVRTQASPPSIAVAPRAAPQPSTAIARPGVAESPTPPVPPSSPRADERTVAHSADDEAARVLAKLRASGAGTPVLERTAAHVFEAFTGNGVAVHFAPPQCFADGCIVDADYGDPNAVQAVNDALPASEAFRAWQGPKYRSPPAEGTDGHVHAHWILFRADI